MSTKPILSSARKLPTLLASLPKHGQGAVVRKTDSKTPDHVYLITRSQLKFLAAAPADSPGDSAPKEGVRVQPNYKMGGEYQKDGYQKISPMEGGRLSAHGKVWGMEFYKGHLRSTVKQFPSVRIRDALKHEWEAVDRSDLPELSRDVIARADAIREQHLARRDAHIKARNERLKELGRARSEHVKAVFARRVAYHKSMNEVRVIY